VTSKLLLFTSIVLIIAVPVVSVGAQTTDSNDGYEPNDSIGTAAEISSGTYSDLQLVSDENDYYALSVEEGDPINITATFPYERTATIPDNDPELTLVDADGNELDDSLIFGPVEGYPFRSLHYEANTSQTVYIRIHGTEDEDTTTEYELTVEQSENDEYEPNGELADATAIEPGTHDGTLLSNEHDFYSLSVEDGDTLNITATYLGYSEYIPDNDPELTLVDSDGNGLTDSLQTSPVDGDAFRHLQYEVTASRTVYVLVEGTNDEEVSVDYNLTVERTEPDENESNGEVNTVTTTTPSGELTTEPSETASAEESVTPTSTRDADETEAQTDGEDGSTENTVGGSGPGFTAAIAVVGLLVAVGLRLRAFE